MSEVAIIAPAIDVEQIAREVTAVHIALQDVERQVAAAEQRTESLRQEQARRRLQLGYLLIEARKAWPARGPKAKGWGEFLAKQGIDDRNARNWMALAGYVEVSESKRSDSEIPTQREVNAARAEQNAPSATRPEPRVVSGEQQELTPSADWTREVEARRQPAPDEDTAAPKLHASWLRDLDRALVGLDKQIMGYAKSWPRPSRKALADRLRRVAEQIEQLPDDEAE